MIRRKQILRLLVNLTLAGMGALAAIALYHWGVMPFFVRYGQETSVPDVRGLAVSEISGMLQSSDLTIGRITEAVDEHIPAGRVVKQQPPPGANTKRGRLVDLVVSLGPAALLVPELEGESLVHARFLLAREGVAVGKIRKICCGGVPAQHIIASSPQPGASLTGRTQVDLLMSDGPAPEYLLMPDLRGLEANAVEQVLREAGMQVHRGRRRDRKGQRGLVLEQTPPPGYPIREDGAVDIVVAQ
ncbi:PASTA domain-containing protein [Candidatus Eisenbacteria bacterium]|uniref:PASTA domain-containing protein n=1 Tax=Eiseniibacteriota bacterium TaxID=2212470 RepID=A0ABV6YJE2_UNCEI